MTTTKKLNAYTASSMYLGYGAVSVNILKSISNHGVEITWVPIGNPAVTTNDHSMVSQWIQNQDSFDVDSPSFVCWHENNLQLRPSRGKCFALSFFELDRLNQRRRTHLNSVDHLITPSKWGEGVLKNNDINVPISVIPMGVDTSIFFPQAKSTQESDPYIFLVCGKLEIRKGHDLLPNIFNQAFSPTDSVEFWMMCDNPFLSQEETNEWENYYKQTPLGDKIRFIRQVPTDMDLAKIINQADCGVSLSRAEGFNLPLLQTMACGKPVITTNYSAHTEFCTSQNAFLIDIDDTEEAYDGKWFGEGTDNLGRWAKIGDQQVQHCTDWMKYVYKQNIRNNEAGIKTAEEMTWDICGQKIIDVIFN